jgi:APA family basic amino acid/polyamine antiporter
VTMCSVFGALNCNLMLGPRIAFAMARDGVFWRPLAHVHPRFRTPAVSIVAQALMSCGLVIVGTYLIVHIDDLIVVLRQTDRFGLFEQFTDAQLRRVNLFDLFTDFVVYSANIFYALCVLGVYVLRYKHPEWERPYRTWGYPVVPALYLAGMGWFLWVAFFSAPMASTCALILMALGIPVYGMIRLLGRGQAR